jgi:hypothetical protein
MALAVVFASLPLATNAAELARCTAADGKSYSYLTRSPCKSPTDVREPVTATRAIVQEKPKPAPEVVMVASRSLLERDIEKAVQAYWRPCNLVQAASLKIVSNENKIVRYTYMLRILSDGARAKPADCPLANSSMLQALANEDLVKLKAGTEVEVTQEQAIR